MRQSIDPLHRALHYLEQIAALHPSDDATRALTERAKSEIAACIDQPEPGEQDRERLIEQIESACLAIARAEFRSAVIDVRGESALDAIATAVTMLGEELSAAQAIRDRADENERARTAAEAASRAKGEFLATMSHEIRTPLNAVIGYSTLLLDTSLSVPQLEYVQAVRTAADGLLGQLNVLLDLSKIEADKLELEHVSTDLRMAMEDTLEILTESARKKKLLLTCVLEPGCPSCIRTDPGRLRQVLLNLVGNAVKFSERGEIIVRAAWLPSETGPLVRVEVTDTGPGIDPKDQHKLFLPFSQIDASMARKHGGSGLGLYLCQKLVSALGGQTGVISHVGIGSTFWFTLPGDRCQPTATEDAVLPAWTRGRHVMLIEPHSSTQQQIVPLLEQLGLVPILCSSAAAVQAVLREQPVRVPIAVLLSNLLPDANSDDLAKALSQHPRLMSPRIVRLLSPTDTVSETSALAEVYSAQLVKPIRARRLIRVLQDVLGQAAAASASQSRPSRMSAVLPIPSSAPPRILVAEDNPANQRLTELMLQRMGCRMDLVADGYEALGAATGFRYDLILMDVQMPRMDGTEAARRIRQLPPPHGSVPIVALTANAFASDRDNSLGAGMDDFLAKPLTFEALRAALLKWLPRHFPAATPWSAADGSSPDRSTAPDDATIVADVAAIRRTLEEMATLLDAASAQKFIELIRKDWPKTLQQAEAHLRGGEWDGLSRRAHYLAGSALQMGASGIARKCKELEACANRQERQSAATLLTGLGAHVPAVLSKL